MGLLNFDFGFRRVAAEASQPKPLGFSAVAVSPCPLVYAFWIVEESDQTETSSTAMSASNPAEPRHF